MRSSVSSHIYIGEELGVKFFKNTDPYIVVLGHINSRIHISERESSCSTRGKDVTHREDLVVCRHTLACVRIRRYTSACEAVA